MAINFPNSPSDGDLYSAVGRTWQYNSTASAWESISESNVTLTGLGLPNHNTLDINSSGQIGDHLIPDTNITRDLGTANNRWRDLYLSGNSIQLGTRQITQDNVPDVNLSIAPEVLEIQVDAPDAGQATIWKWTWEQSTLPYARRTITNSNELNVPLYKEGTYVVNNFAAYDIHGSMTQTHSLYLKWIDGAGTDNLVSWATSAGPISDTHASINGGNATDVQRITVNVPSTITLPSLTNPSVSYTVVNNGSGGYTFSGSAKGDNPNLGPFYRGGTYTVNINATGHPFYFTTDNGTNFASGTYFGEYTSGVTGSRTDSGTITFTVPAGAPDTLYYQCGNHSAMRGEITVKDLAVETNINGNYVVYFQHTQEGHKTAVELRPIPSLVNQMCLVYDSTSGKFVPQDLATYVENTPSFENKIREVAGTAELVVEDGSAVIAKVNVYDDSTYLPLTGNNPGDQAFATDTDILYIWDGSAWQQAGAANSDDLTEGSTNLFFTDARVSSYLSSNDFDTATNIVASITDSAPATLDTLNELAAALGDDPNFATTTANNIATKLAITDFTSTADTWIGTKDTGALSEGSNLYYTNTRVDARIALQAGSNLDLSGKSTSDLSEGTNLYYTDARVDARITASDTDALSEGSTNLYYTDARVKSSTITGGSLRGTVNNTTVQYATSYSGTPAQGSFFFDSLNQKLKVYTGSAFVDAVPAGGGGGGGDETDANATFVKYTYTITSSTNSVSGADDASETLTYTTGGNQNVEAYVNGIKQTEGASNDYVATTGSSVVFTYNIPAGSTVDIQVYELLTNDAYYLKTETYTQTETNSQISTALAGLVDSAPTALDTLNELAAALGDDANFSTTVTNSIADKLPLAGGTLTGDLYVNTNIGVGTTSPTNNEWSSGAKFITIDATSTNSYGVLSLKGDRNSTGTTHAFQIGAGDGKLYLAYDDVANNHRIIVYPSGDIGIGEDAGLAQGGNYGQNVHIHSTGTGSSLKLTDVSTGSQTTSGFELITTGLAGYVWNREAGKLSFATSNLERALIDANGKVILGGAESTIGSNNVLTINNDGNNAAYPAIALQNTAIGTGNGQGMWLGILGAGSNLGRGYVWNYENQPLWLGTNGAARQVIQADGKISIGANAEFTPSGRVHIKGGNGDQLVLDNAGERFTQISLRESDTQNGALWLDSTDDMVDLYANTSHGIRLKTGGDNTRVTIGSNGDVDINNAGIGAGNTGAGLKVQSITSGSGAIAARSQTHNNVFGVLPWSDGRIYLSSGTHYENGTWKTQTTGGAALLSISSNHGLEWWAGDGSADDRYSDKADQRRFLDPYGQIITREKSYNTGYGSGAYTATSSTSWGIINIQGTGNTGSRPSGNAIGFNKISNDSDLILSFHMPYYFTGQSADSGFGVRLRYSVDNGASYGVDWLTDGPAHGWGAGGYGQDNQAGIFNYTWNTEKMVSNTFVGTVRFYFETKVWAGGNTVYWNYSSYSKYGHIHIREVVRT